MKQSETNHIRTSWWQNRSLIFRIVVITLSILILSTISLGAFSYGLNRNNAATLNAEKAMTIAKIIAQNIDGDQMRQILQTGEKNDYWYATKTFVNGVYRENNILYLYILSKDYDTNVKYFMEGYPSTPIEDEPELDLGATEPIEYHDDNLFATLASGQASRTGIYTVEDFGSMVSGFAPVLDGNGAVVGVVGVDIDINEVVSSANQFALLIIIFIAFICVICGLIITWYVKRSVGNPIKHLSSLAKGISQGDVNITIDTQRNDEIGQLIREFGNMVDSTKKQAEVFEALAAGDLSVDIKPRSEKDIINLAIAKMSANLNHMFMDINNSTMQVSSGAKQISDGSQSLAQGASEQAAAVQQLSATITEVAAKTKDNVGRANQAAQLSVTMKQNVENGSAQMQNMLQAVKEIGEASHSIGKVIKVIDDIAFQTNILALNAAVEAARAGQHGKGFAVVAEEVRSLAAKSAAAAKDTDVLISNSIEKAQLGVSIAAETAGSLEKIVTGINENSRIVGEIAHSSEEQSTAIQYINSGIDRVTQVVQQNSATAKQSATASEEMNQQAGILEDLISQFTLKDQPKRLGM